MTDTAPKKRFSRIRIVASIIILLVIAAGLLWLLGPREPVDLTFRFEPARLGDDLDAYLQANEAGVANLRPNSAKEIVWAYPASRARTPVALVYLHGFSAAKAEIRPVPDMVAAELGANLYFARLKGHGRDGAAMAEASVNDWVQDAAEAVAIGERIGEKLVLIGTSTGGTLATLAASLPELRDRIDALVLVSPNFAIRAAGSDLLTMPFGEALAKLAVGRERSWKPSNDEHGANWTTAYPTEAVMPMAALVRRTAAMPFEQMTVPTLFVFHPDDTVVDQSVTAQVAERWGGPVTVVRLDRTDSPDNHVVAGDIISPSNNEPVAEAILKFVQSLPQ